MKTTKKPRIEEVNSLNELKSNRGRLIRVRSDLSDIATVSVYVGDISGMQRFVTGKLLQLNEPPEYLVWGCETRGMSFQEGTVVMQYEHMNRCTFNKEGGTHHLYAGDYKKISRLVKPFF